MQPNFRWLHLRPLRKAGMRHPATYGDQCFSPPSILRYLHSKNGASLVESKTHFPSISPLTSRAPGQGKACTHCFTGGYPAAMLCMMFPIMGSAAFLECSALSVLIESV
ncbi:hypothetical protein V5799_027841 [Amblyomma americanum]|uniref:Uncharacterized protein n=1 Tax=Amblyomma americanum TaxID=6943 RepID=A0AAQ4DEK2_AMBAM